MQRVVVLGRGAAGKSALAARLGEITGLPVLELDALFWQVGLKPRPRNEWVELQREFANKERWIMDGDLGPYDALDIRLEFADTVVLLDFSLVRCGWRAIRRSRERLDFWVWLATYRRRYLPAIRRSIQAKASAAEVFVLRTPRDVEQFVSSVPAG